MCPQPERDSVQQSKEWEHKKAEQFNWKVQNGINILTVIAASVAALFAYRAFQQSKRQADAAWDQNRPWITLNLASPRVLFGPSDNAFFANHTLTNSGHLTATAIRMNSVFLPEKPGIPLADGKGEIFDPELTRIRDGVCDDAQKEMGGTPLTRPPGTQNSPTLLVAVDEIKGQNRPTEYHFHLISCITYRYAGSDEVHHTASVYIVARKTHYSPQDDLMPGLTVEQVLPKGIEAIGKWTFPPKVKITADVDVRELDQFALSD